MSSTATAPRRTRRPMTEVITTKATTFVGNPQRGPVTTRLENWSAESIERIPGTDRPLWTYRRVETPGTPWLVTHEPTGMETQFGNLTAARRYTADPATPDFLRHQAAAVITAGGRSNAIVMKLLDGRLQRVEEDPAEVAARLAVAVRQVAILDGAMLPAAYGNSPEAACVCGGLLAWRGRWVHTDACPACWRRRDGWTTDRRCPELASHTVCTRPTPEPCEHHHRGIAVDSSLTPYPCAAERDNCCGCCHGEG